MAATKPRALARRLDALRADQDVAAHRAADPVGFVHRYERKDDQEIAGLVASSLAFGRVASVRASVARVLGVLAAHGGPAAAVEHTSEDELREALGDFVHRVYRGPDVARVLANAGMLRRTYGSLGHFFASRRGPHQERAAQLADALRGAPNHDSEQAQQNSRGLRHLMPDPRAGSACKRLNLYLRWMVRPADGVDLGLWPTSPAELVIPVDTHVHRIAKNLGLTQRNDASWRTAEEITSTLRVLDPDDPVKYDFALCHLGISRECPSRRDEDKCARCALRTVCLHWRGRAR